MENAYGPDELYDMTSAGLFESILWLGPVGLERCTRLSVWPISCAMVSAISDSNAARFKVVLTSLTAKIVIDPARF